MAKYKVKKDVFEQVTINLKKAQNRENKGNLEEISPISKESVNLPSSKNIFSRGDFDKYKISDEELHNLCIQKSNIMPIGHITVHPDGSLSQKYGKADWRLLPYRLKDLGTKDLSANEVLDRLNFAMQCPVITNIQPIKIPHFNNEKDLVLFLKPYLDEIKNVIKNKTLRCKSNGKLITQFNDTHCYKNKNGLRIGEDLQNHAGYLPFVIPIIKKYGKADVRNNKQFKSGVYSKKTKTKSFKGYGTELIARAEIINPKTGNKERIGISVVLAEIENNSSELKDISVFRMLDKFSLVKSLSLDCPEISNGFKSDLIKNLPDHRTYKSIQQLKKMSTNSVQKSLTYSGYKLQGRMNFAGMKISIENKKGSYRSGADKDGHKWRTYMNYDYGYIRETEGVDGDHVDCYIGPDKNSKTVYIIHQNDPVTKKYDEDKCMLCFSSEKEAKEAYLKQYDRPGFFGSMDKMEIDQFKSYVFSHLGKRIHKSFDIQISDITENNKQQKMDQLEKALNAIYENKPFVIKHIPADSSQNYGSMTLKIRNFDRNKIEKAVHKMAFSLDTTVKTSKGEAFNFKAQEDLTNDIVSEITEKTKNLYSWIISYFGLPEIRVVSKADLMHKGKVVYNPETGLPIKESDWKNFVKGLENFLNRNYNGIGPKIVLNAQQLGVILDRIMARKPLNEVQKMTLDDVKQQYRSAEWISNSVKNMTDQFGESFSRDRQARLEVAIHSAGARMAGVSDEIKNKVQQTIIDGIKNKQSRAQVSQNLFDKLVGLNRDMQKIADTETQNNVNNAYLQEEVYKTAPGEKVYFKRYEIDDDNTCKYCKAVKGAIALWSDTALPDEAIDDPYAEFAIWEGKEGGSLPTGVLHPYCRGSWYRYYPEVDD